MIDLAETPTVETPAVVPGTSRRRNRSKVPATVGARRRRMVVPVAASVTDYDPEDDQYPNDVYVQVEETSRDWDMYTPTGDRQAGTTSRPKAKGVFIEFRRPRKTALRGIIDDEIVNKHHKFPFRAIDSPLVRNHHFPVKEVVKALYQMRDNGQPLILTAVNDAQLQQEKKEKRRIRVPGTSVDESKDYTPNVRYPSALPSPTMPVGY